MDPYKFESAAFKCAATRPQRFLFTGLGLPIWDFKSFLGNFTMHSWGWGHCLQFSSVHFSRSVVSDCLRPHESQHARPPCPSPTPRVHQNSCPLSQWCHPAISSSVVPSPPAPNPSQHQNLFQWVNSSHEVARVSALVSFFPKNTQDWSPLEWTGWISLQSKGLSRVFSNTTVQKHQFFGTQLSSQSNSHIHTWPLEKP